MIPEPDIRRLAIRILLAQASVTIIIAGVCGAFWGDRHGGSALVGGAIGTLANLYMTVAALRMSRSAGGALGRLMLGQLVKVVLTVALFVIAARSGKVKWIPLLGTYTATLMAFWSMGLRSRNGKSLENRINGG